MFRSLETEFNQARSTPRDVTEEKIRALQTEGEETLGRIKENGTEVPFEDLVRLEAIQFQLAAYAAAGDSFLPEVQEYIHQVRRDLLRAARFWLVNRRDVHEAIYRVIYGGRAAIEEALIQNRSASLSSILTIDPAPSSTPGIVVEGVEVHSGDILLSRGGAPTSALIARGNDFPGFFSHAALLHVDPKDYS